MTLSRHIFLILTISATPWLGGCGLFQEKPAVHTEQATALVNQYTQAVITADVADRLGMVDGEMRQLMTANIGHLVKQIEELAGKNLKVCTDLFRCPGRALIIRFVEDNPKPYLDLPVLMGSRLEGYLVIADAESGIWLASHRIRRARTYEGVFTQIRDVLGTSLLPNHMQSNVPGIQAIAPELMEHLLTQPTNHSSMPESWTTYQLHHQAGISAEI